MPPEVGQEEDAGQDDLMKRIFQAEARQSRAPQGLQCRPRR